MGITRATDIFAFLSSHFDTLDVQKGLLASAALVPTNHTLDIALALAPPAIRNAYAVLATSNGFPFAPQSHAFVPPNLTTHMDAVVYSVAATRTLPPPPLTPNLSWQSSSSAHQR